MRRAKPPMRRLASGIATNFNPWDILLRKQGDICKFKKKWHTYFALKLCTFLLAVIPVAAAPMYSTVNIGGVGGSLSEAFAISASGAVAGRALDANNLSVGFAYEGFVQALGSDTDVRGINSNGEVVGTVGGYATVWRGGSAEKVGSLGGDQSYGIGI